MMRDFKEWIDDRLDEAVVARELRQAYKRPWDDVEEEDWKTHREVRLPKVGDFVISQPSAVFRMSQGRNGWVQPKSRRNLYRSKMPMYMIAKDQDPTNDGKYLAYVFSQSDKRNKRSVFLDLNDLYDITDAYPAEERQNRNIWLWLKPEQTQTDKYRQIYGQWYQKQGTDYDPLLANIQRMANAPEPEVGEEPLFQTLQNRNQRYWKYQMGEQKTYGNYPKE